MKNKVLLITVAASLAIPTLALANSAILHANREIGIALGGQSLSYQEYNPRVSMNPLDSESGKQPALKLRFSLQGSLLGMRNLYTHVALSYAQGSTHYQGFSQNLVTNATAPLSASTHDDTYAGSVRFGKGFVFGENCNYQLTPELVYSYDTWHRSVGGGISMGYLEVYKHQAAGVGLMGQAAYGRWVFGLTLTGEKTFSASMSSPFAQSLSLGGRYANSEDLNVDYRMSRSQHLTLALEHSHFLYGHSAVVAAQGSYLQEPSSETNLNSVYAGYAWSF